MRTIEGLYTSYVCKRCRKEMILITEEVESTFREGQYISCSHCGCRNIVKELTTSDLREVMKARRYKRNKHGALEQL